MHNSFENGYFRSFRVTAGKQATSLIDAKWGRSSDPTLTQTVLQEEWSRTYQTRTEGPEAGDDDAPQRKTYYADV